jgi:hypothetical protein
MDYSDSKIQICLGDKVLVDFDLKGVVVCDFKQQACLDGYEDWLMKEELIGGGFLNDGLLVNTESVGLIHCMENETYISRLS